MVKVEFVEDGHTFKAWPSEHSYTGPEDRNHEGHFVRTREPLILQRVVNGEYYRRWNAGAWVATFNEKYHWYSMGTWIQGALSSPQILCGGCLSDAFRVVINRTPYPPAAICCRCGYSAEINPSVKEFKIETPGSQSEP